MSLSALVAIALVGMVAGVVNTLAGGGSLLTLPALMLLGLPADIANGTNRLSIVTHGMTGTLAFKKQGNLPTDALLSMIMPTVSGAVVGAVIATKVPPEVLKPIMLIAMVSIALLIAMKKSLLVPEANDEVRPKSVASTFGLFLAGVYGGFIQAGVGFLMLAVLGGVLRYDLVRANALKLACVLIFGTVALVIFAQAHQVRWIPAIALAVGSTLGALIGVNVVNKIPKEVFRWVVFVCVLAASIAIWLRQ